MSDDWTPARQDDAGTAAPFRSWMDPRLDFRRSVPLRRSYIVASSYRCGSTFLCSELWQTGVLGAPSEYVNIGEGRAVIATAFEPGVMMSRLQATSPEDYFVKLLARRTSSNGVFGMKVHFHHFEPALSWFPSMLKLLSPVTYIYVNRRDRLAQAVSIAKAMQTNAWTSMDSTTAKILRYDEDLLGQCLENIREQRLGWLRWFEVNNITPFVVTYEDLVADKGAVVRGIIELLEVQSDEPDEVRLPIIEKQGDETNMQWAARFWQETNGFGASLRVTAADVEADSTS